MRTNYQYFFLILVSVCLSACVGIPEGVKVVEDFISEKYLGQWYEIARLDHSFERGLQRVTAEYSLRDDGGLRVINRGFDENKQQWKQAEGKAYFVGSETEAHLKVSFFGPFYASYVVFELDQPDYQYAFVSGNSTSYLWLLARKPEINQDVIKHFVEKSRSLGFNTDELIFVKH
ncbi:MAG: lipocalin family protein [Gammaproteobacteria bacterium]|nr:lipocalin family protein [Gammaproteobacteria bacterium]MDH5728996.1 lipocalin family protein [Gammaproteobacteria bacterium]